MSGRSSRFGFIKRASGMRSATGSTSLIPNNQHIRLDPADPLVICGISLVKFSISTTRKKCLANPKRAIISNSSSNLVSYFLSSGSCLTNLSTNVSNSLYLCSIIASYCLKQYLITEQR